VLAACDASDAHVRQAFSLAAKKGDERAVLRMLAIDPSLARTPWTVWMQSGRPPSERLPLNGAATAGQVGVARILLDHGAAIEGKDETGATPLILALRGLERADIVQLLLERGASTAARDADKLGALDHALQHPDTVSAVLLCAHGDTATLGSDRNRLLSRFVAPGGGCAELKRTWSETPEPQRPALLRDVVCRLDGYACKALEKKTPR